MRDTLLLPIVFLLLFVIVLAFITTCTVLLTWDITYNPEFQRAPDWLSNTLQQALFKCYTVSLLISLFLTFGRLKRRPGFIILSFFLLLFVSAAALFLGFQITADNADTTRPVPSARPFVSRAIHPIDGGRLYIEKTAGTSGGAKVEGFAVHSEDGITFSQYATVGIHTGNEGVLVVAQPSEIDSPSIPVIPANPVYSPPFAMPQFLKSMIEEINLLNEYLNDARRGSAPRLLLAAFSLAVFVLGGRFLFRLSRWPLFNILLTLALFRGVFFTIRFLNSEIGGEIISLIPYTDATPDLASIFYLLIGVLFIAADLILIRKSGKPMPTRASNG